jgi:outer membrane protein W
LKKLLALLIITFVFIGLNSSVYSQPQLKINVFGGYNLPLPDLKGDLESTTDAQNTYLMKMGFGFGANAKYYLGKKRNVGVTLGLGYQLFSNSADTSAALLSSNIKTKLNAFTAGLGVEYSFMPKGKAQPFFGAEFTAHFFSGETELTYAGTTQKATLKSASRFGAAVGAGVDIKLSKQIGIVIGAKYNLANLIGKAYDSVTTATEYNLNDKEHTSGSTTIKSRNISYIQAYLGLTFFLNEPKRRK